MKSDKNPGGFASLEYWACEALRALVDSQGATAAVDFALQHPLTTPAEVKAASSDCIAGMKAHLWSVEDVRAIWQYSQMLKKFRKGGDPSDDEAVAGWIERNEWCAGGHLLPGIAAIMASLLAPLGPAYARASGTGAFGPGAVLGKGRRSPVWKWNWLATSPDYLDIPIEAVRGEYVPAEYSHRENFSRLSCVWKDMFKKRVVTTYDADVAFFQKMTRDRLLNAAKEALPLGSAIPQQRYGKGEQKQRLRCYRGSREGTLATLDLSSASDSISWVDVVDVFPANIVSDLHRTRSKVVIIGDKRYPVYMYAGMGDATTFVVESIFFWALFTAIRVHLHCRKTAVSVYGDDIVCGSDLANHPLFAEIVASCGVTVNKDKSCSDVVPGFREACGVVAYKGHDVPLLRIQGYDITNPTERQALCDVVNTLCAESSPSWLQLLGRRLRRKLICGFGIPAVPHRLSSSGCYLVVPEMDPDRWTEPLTEARSRWNPTLYRREWRVGVARPVTRTVYSQHATLGEALGILHGQLSTVNASEQLALGRRTRYGFQFPLTDKTEMRAGWYPADSCHNCKEANDEAERDFVCVDRP